MPPLGRRRGRGRPRHGRDIAARLRRVTQAGLHPTGVETPGQTLQATDLGLGRRDWADLPLAPAAGGRLVSVTFHFAEAPMFFRLGIRTVLVVAIGWAWFAPPAVADNYPRQPGVDAIHYVFRLT